MECRVLGLFAMPKTGRGRVGLAFGRDHLALAVMRREGGQPVLERCELVPLDSALGTGDPPWPPFGTPACRGWP